MSKKPKHWAAYRLLEEFVFQSSLIDADKCQRDLVRVDTP